MEKIYFQDSDFSADCASSSFSFSRIKYYFMMNNYDVVDTLDEADTIIMNTCGVFIDFEEKYIEYIVNVRKKYEDAKKIVVFGCLAGPSKKISELADFIVPTKKEHMFDSLFPNTIPFDQISPIAVNSLDIGVRKDIRDRKKKKYFLQVNRGCIHNCTYCGIKKSIGHVKSKALEEVLQEAKFAIYEGYEEIHIVTDDIASWGNEIGMNYTDMLNPILALEGEFIVTINYAEPSEFMKWFPLLRNFDKVKHIAYPIQSFNNRILDLMGRKYTVEDFVNSVKEMRRLSPDIKIQNHIIFCYPTETFEEFKNNLGGVHLFDDNSFLLYSPIPGTKVFQESEYVSSEQIKSRVVLLYKFSLRYPEKYEFSSNLRNKLSQLVHH